MDTLVQAIVSITLIGLICAALLSFLGKLMYVKVDERIQAIRDCMPGANCGACGFSGCDGYASAMIVEGAPINKCPPGGGDLVKRISAIMGTESGGDVAKLIAVVHCCGDTDTSNDKMEYRGLYTCLAANEIFGGQTACTFGCLGYGDCKKVCPSSAICIEKNLARIDLRKCTGCGLCVKACPKKVISIETEPVAVVVKCKNTEKGAALKDKCSKGCIGCMKCAKECPNGAITIVESLAIIDYSKCDGCRKCIDSCVKKCIV